MRFLITFLLSIILITVAHSEPIGKTKKVTPAAHGTTSGTLRVDSDIHSLETINTDTGGQAGIEFKDQSKIDIGPRSSVKMDKFVYNPAKNKGEIVLSATKGSFRYATGGGNKGSYKIKTPYGTLGIRG